MKKALSNSKIITMLLVAILMISAFAMGNFSLNRNALAEQRNTIIANDTFETLNTDTWAVDGDGFAVSNGSLKLEGGSKGDKIVSKKVVSTDTSIISDMTVISAKFYAKYSAGMPRFAFGLDADGNVTENSFIVQFGHNPIDDKKIAAIVFDVYRDGDVLKEESKNIINFSSIDKGSVVEIKVNKNQTLSIYENGTLLVGYQAGTTGIDNYAGACGFILGSSSDKMTIDNLEITASSYYVPTSKSVSTTFDDNYKGQKLGPDFVLKAEDSTKLAIENKALVYAGASENDYFGSSYEYDAFMVDYKISGISYETSENAWIGVEFARTAKDAPVGNANKIAFNLVSGEVFFDGDGDLTTVDHNLAELLVNATYSENGTIANIKASDVINVRVVAKDSKVELYVRSMGDIEYTLYATVENVNIVGYVAIVASAGAYMTLDDVAFINQSKIYNLPLEESPEKIYDIIPLPHDYNKYRENPENLKEELNYLNTSEGSGSSIVGAIVIPSAILICIAAAAIVVKKAKEAK